ncbi:hypothetical protein NFI96_004818 [Prochilodus magdalenae]|nr:hypothetical protein NFI96_004818 [Prochilodus magdalenae]
MSRSMCGKRSRADVDDWLKGVTEHVGVAKDHSVKAEGVYQQWLKSQSTGNSPRSWAREGIHQMEECLNTDVASTQKLVQHMPDRWVWFKMLVESLLNKLVFTGNPVESDQQNGQPGVRDAGEAPLTARAPNVTLSQNELQYSNTGHGRRGCVVCCIVCVFVYVSCIVCVFMGRVRRSRWGVGEAIDSLRLCRLHGARQLSSSEASLAPPVCVAVVTPSTRSDSVPRHHVCFACSHIKRINYDGDVKEKRQGLIASSEAHEMCLPALVSVFQNRDHVVFCSVSQDEGWTCLRFKTLMFTFEAETGPALRFLRAMVKSRSVPRALQASGGSNFRLLQVALHEDDGAISTCGVEAVVCEEATMSTISPTDFDSVEIQQQYNDINNRWDLAAEAEWDNENSSARLFERSRIKALAVC